MQLGVGEVALLALLAAPVERDPVSVARLNVAVQAVVRRVQLAVGEPLVERRVGIVEDLGRLLEPVQLLGLLEPPPFSVLLGLFVDRRIVQQRVLYEFFRWIELLDLQHLFELGLECLVICVSC